MPRHVASALLALTVACTKPTPSPASASASAPTAASSVPSAQASASPVQETPDAALASALVSMRIAPAVPPFERGMMDHADLVGFTDDGATLGYCSTGGGRPSVVCGWRKGGKPDTEVHEDDAKGQAMLARMKAAGLGKPRANSWPYDDLEVTWSATDGDGVKPGSLHVGVRVKGEPTAGAVDLSGSAILASWHVEFLGLSPDGSQLGVVGHGFGGEFSDTFAIDSIATNVAAGRAYNDAGYAHHKAKDYPRAVALFRRAVAVDATHPLARYNLACAVARSHDAGAAAALDDAIAQGGAKVKTRARADADFAEVKGEPWFQKATGP